LRNRAAHFTGAVVSHTTSESNRLLGVITIVEKRLSGGGKG
jgi:hypothetical protein